MTVVIFPSVSAIADVDVKMTNQSIDERIIGPLVRPPRLTNHHLAHHVPLRAEHDDKASLRYILNISLQSKDL